MIYVPSYWWHEVITNGDFEGKSIGINYFFEPFYIRRRAGKHVMLHKNRMYAHLHGEVASAVPCAKKNICFKKSIRNSKNSNRDNKERKLKRRFKESPDL
jgi:hypothetical protein